MCVIAFCEKGKNQLSSAELSKMWEYNPDGAGIMYANGTRVHILKGLMSFDAFAAAWADVPDNVPTAVHMRIATHGGISTGMTHPFPLCSSDNDMAAPALVTARPALMHNGVFSFCGNSKQSDTFIFTRDVISPIYAAHAFHPDADTARAIETITHGSRVVVLHPDGTRDFFGDWKEKNGVMYSNLNHDAPRIWYPATWLDTDAGKEYDYTPTETYTDDAFPLYDLPVMVRGDGVLYDPDFFGIDENNNIYIENDAGEWEPCPGFTAETANGTPLTFEKVVRMWS